MADGDFGMNFVDNSEKLCTDKFYALHIDDSKWGVKELGRYVGLSDEGASFVIMPSLVRHDFVVRNITIRNDMIPGVVFELGES